MENIQALNMTSIMNYKEISQTFVDPGKVQMHGWVNSQGICRAQGFNDYLQAYGKFL